MSKLRFRPPRLDDIEYVEDYRLGGFHPVIIGDSLGQGRYRIIHKLGFGGSSTIWLARNLRGKLVALKVMRAEVLSKPVDHIPDLVVPKRLLEYVRSSGTVVDINFQTIEHHFTEVGPNGSHLCLVYQLGGPSMITMTNCPGRVIGSRRLRGDLARKVAREVVSVVQLMHAAGFVHGDITTSNILFRVADNVQHWSDSEVLSNLGPPETEQVVTLDHNPPGLNAPAQLVAPIDGALLSHSSLLQERAFVIDFGQAFYALSPPKDYEPATVPHFQSPETYFDQTIGLPSDLWALACAIFEIRAGFPLFEAFLGGNDEILKAIVQTLGKLPEPWWTAFENHGLWFHENGEPKTLELQQVLLPAEKTSIMQKLLSIGTQDDSSTVDEGPMFERAETTLDAKEVELLGDLLQKMLQYRPRDRITIRDVVSHPWFTDLE